MPISQRRVTRAEEMRALAHPVRLKLLELLSSEGPFTASEAARRLDETPANISWHLRTLARYGFVRQGTGAGRNRPWKLVAQSMAFGDDAEDRAAATALNDLLYDREFAVLRASMRDEEHDPEEWRHSRMVVQSRLWLTADEAAALGRRLHQLLLDEGLADRNEDPSRRPAGARLMAAVGWVVPAAPVAEQPAVGAADDERLDGEGLR